MYKLKVLFILILILFSSNSFGQWSIVAEDIDEELICMAKNIYFEAGNQPLAGKLSVAFVTINRVVSSQFPDSVCDVIYQAEYRNNYMGNEVPIIDRCQFSWFCDGKSDTPTDSYTWLQSMEVAREILEVNNYQSRMILIDNTEGALWYHADYVKPNWSNYLQEIVTIENHIFYK